jgi:hypothetical protein
MVLSVSPLVVSIWVSLNTRGLTSWQSATVLSSAVIMCLGVWGAGRVMLGFGAAFAFRVGQLVDLQLYVIAAKEGVVTPDKLLKAIVQLCRAGIERSDEIPGTRWRPARKTASEGTGRFGRPSVNLYPTPGDWK